MKNQVKQFAKRYWKEMLIVGCYAIGCTLAYNQGMKYEGKCIRQGFNKLVEYGIWFVPEEVDKFHFVKLEDLKK